MRFSITNTEIDTELEVNISQELDDIGFYIRDSHYETQIWINMDVLDAMTLVEALQIRINDVRKYQGYSPEYILEEDDNEEFDYTWLPNDNIIAIALHEPSLSLDLDVHKEGTDWYHIFLKWYDKEPYTCDFICDQIGYTNEELAQIPIERWKPTIQRALDNIKNGSYENWKTHDKI